MRRLSRERLFLSHGTIAEDSLISVERARNIGNSFFLIFSGDPASFSSFCFLKGKNN